MVLVVTAGNPRGTWPLRGIIKTCPVFQLCPTVVVSNDDLRKGNDSLSILKEEKVVAGWKVVMEL